MTSMIGTLTNDEVKMRLNAIAEKRKNFSERLRVIKQDFDNTVFEDDLLKQRLLNVLKILEKELDDINNAYNNLMANNPELNTN